MRAGKPPVRSFDELARRCLAHDRWPAEFRLHSRSLGALLGKLDREVELEWLTNRPAAQETLASVLSTTREELLIALQPTSSAPGRYVRLRDLPSGRLIDLIDEPLFPGVPDEVLQPASWGRLWWATPSGSGRSLVRAWLSARGRLPASRTVARYVELDSPTEPLPEARLGLCVAAPFLPPADAGFRVVESTPVEQRSSELVAWAADRLPQGGRFDREELARFLRDGPIARGGVESAGAVIGLCGLVDEFGIDEIRRRTPRQLVQWYLRRRANETLDSEGQATQWVKRSAGDALIALLRQLLSDSDEPWWKPRSPSEWTNLLPAELRRDADLDWLKLSLSRTNPSIRPSDVERAARELPPGAFRLLRAFERMGVLARGERDELVLGPHWLIELALGEALDELVRGAPSEWGEALLRPLSAPAVARALWSRVQSGDSAPLDDVLELEPEHDPALVAAAEAAYRIAGLAALGGLEFSTESAESSFRLARGLALFPAGSPPLPRIEHRPVCAGGQKTRAGDALLSRGAYLLASWALLEQLPPSATRGDPALRPFAESADETTRCVLDEVLRALEALPELELDEAAAALVGRLATPRAATSLHALEAPAAAITELERRALEASTWQKATSSAFGRRALVALLRARPELRARVWSAWSAEHGLALDSDAELARLLWSQAPGRVISELVSRAPEHVAFDLLGAEQWAAVRSAAIESASTPGHIDLWLHMPDALLAELVRAGREPRDRSCLRQLWRRAPELLMDALAARFAANPGSGPRAPATDLLHAAPEELGAELAKKLASEQQLASLTSERVRELEHWFHQRVAARAPGWRSAYEALAALEQRLSGIGP